MGQGEVQGIDHQVVIEEQVEVDRPFPPAILAAALERVLHGEQGAEQVAGGQVGLDEAGAVEEGALVRRTANWPRLEIAAHGHKIDARHEPQQLQAAVELLASPPQIGATSDQASCHRCRSRARS